MKRIAMIVITALAILTVDAWAQPNAQHLQNQVIMAHAKLYDYLLTITGGEDPKDVIVQQSNQLIRAREIVKAHGDTSLVRKFQEIGFTFED